MNEKKKDLIYSALFIIFLVVIALARMATKADEVYMQLYSPAEHSAPVRGLSMDARMTIEECEEQKKKVEAPLSVGGYSTPSGWVVDCIPVGYLDD